MIKFFRRIRKKLIEEGNLNNYLAYAIGEIVLVMLGILLALQVNEWNQNRKDRNLEKSYYCKLLEDIEQDVYQIEKHILENEDRIKSSNQLLHLLQQNTPTQNDVIQALAGSTSKTTYTFQPSLAAFEDLKSSGNLKIIKDRAIKDSLINYYSVLEGFTDIIDVNSDFTVNLYFDPNKDFTEIGWQNIDFVKNEIDTALVDFSLLNNLEFPSKAVRKQLRSDGIFYMTTNARKKMIYNIMAKEIYNMQALMAKKCTR